MIIYSVKFPNGKYYVGLTKFSIHLRKSQHYHKAFVKKTKSKFYSALRKYKGLELWEEVLCCFDYNDLKEFEILFIGIYDSYNNGYNGTLGGDGNNGLIVSEGTRKKMSLRLLGENNPRYGVRLSDETKKRISQANKGKLKGVRKPKRTSDHCRKISETKKKIGQPTHLRGVKGFEGKSHTSETKKKMMLSSKTRKSMVCLETGEKFTSILELSKALKIDFSYIAKRIRRDGFYMHLKTGIIYKMEDYEV